MKRDEKQEVEYKESWHDKYFEWICGYANANCILLRDVSANGVIKSEIRQDNYSVQDILGVINVIISKIWYNIFRL